MKILGIETSCDETAAAVVENGNKILSNSIFSQINKHKPFGGVVPEIASRNHVIKLPEIVNCSLNDAQVSLKEIDAIAVRPKIAIKKYSAGPNNNATSAKGGANKSKTKPLIKPPKTLAKVEILIA